MDRANLRVRDRHFFKELLRDQRRSIGRLDSRFVGIDKSAVTETIDHDPSMSAIMPPYTAMFNQYAREALGYTTDTKYEILSFDVNQGWEWDRGKFPDTSEPLRSAMAMNPFMRVLVAQGYFDLATPHMGAEYTLGHMSLDPALMDQITVTYYGAGHMHYLDVTALAEFKQDVAAFFKTALSDEE